MADEEKTTPAAEAEEGKDSGCPVLMHDDKRCGRPIHRPDSAVDKEPVCLMHSGDPDKSDQEFQEEFKRVIEEAGEGLADFTGFVFLSSVYSDREFRGACRFYRCEFKQAATFEQATFKGDADFSMATFAGQAMFMQAKFMRAALFFGVHFGGRAFFLGCEFMGRALFSGSSFDKGVLLHRARFSELAELSGATFMGGAELSGVAFIHGADLSGSIFMSKADLSGSVFSGPAEFSDTTFCDLANFSTAVFRKEAKFAGALFKGDASFWLTEFDEIADFHNARFRGQVEFRETRISKDERAQPGPVFVLAQFEKPNRAYIYKTYLGRSLLHNSDVSQIVFSNIEWRRRSRNNKAMLYEEVIDVSKRAAAALRPEEGASDERNYDLIAETYQQLKRNYDAKCEYSTAGDFHYGEMEMKWLSSPRRNKFLRWWHRNLGLVALYRLASEYGESYVRPAVVLGIVLLLFTLAYPVAGLHSAGATKYQGFAGDVSRQRSAVTDLSYMNLFQFPGGPLQFYKQSLTTTLGIAFFERELAFRPDGTTGLLLKWSELLLTYTLVALFLLALRRQFMR